MQHINQADRRLLLEIKLDNLLSFGPGTPPLKLEALNVLIGPNAAGKSNLIEALSLIRAAPVSAASSMDLRGVVRRGGGVSEWLWKGGRRDSASIRNRHQVLEGGRVPKARSILSRRTGLSLGG
jgi:predicted ATPase